MHNDPGEGFNRTGRFSIAPLHRWRKSLLRLVEGPRLLNPTFFQGGLWTLPPALPDATSCRPAQRDSGGCCRRRLLGSPHRSRETTSRLGPCFGAQCQIKSDTHSSNITAPKKNLDPCHCNLTALLGDNACLSPGQDPLWAQKAHWSLKMGQLWERHSRESLFRHRLGPLA
jgi:hypothetical protein